MTPLDTLVTKAIKPISPKKPYLPPNLRPNLTGRKVYFNMGAKEFKVEKNIQFLTPGKLYTIIEERRVDSMYKASISKLVYIKDDKDYTITIVLGDTCAHLNFLAKWILQKEPKK